MNIFVTSPDPYACAQYLDDKRVVKMVLETAQLLATAINENGGKASYKSTHINHPCTVWARDCRANYVWLLHHFDALCMEYYKRFGKVHKCSEYKQEFIAGTLNIKPNQDEIRTDFPNCTTYKHLSGDDVYQAYQLYLNDKWKNDKRKPRWHGQTRSEYA